MESKVDIIEEIETILRRLENGQIRPEYAKSELHFMIHAARNVEELTAAYNARSQVEVRKPRVSTVQSKQ